MSEVVEKQREALVATIKDAESKEKQRIKRLAYVKNPNEQKALLVRFDKERNMDRQRIEQLTNDLLTLKKCSEEGQLSEFVEQRNIFKQSMRSTGQLMNDSAPNRFSGLEDYDSQVFHRCNQTELTYH
jgi:hypothetical protein